MGVFIISPSDKGGQLYNPPAKLVDLCQPLSPMVFNDLFCLSHPQIHTLSLGAARPTDFDEHLKTLPIISGSSNPFTSHCEPTRTSGDRSPGGQLDEYLAGRAAGT